MSQLAEDRRKHLPRDVALAAPNAFLDAMQNAEDRIGCHRRKSRVQEQVDQFEYSDGGRPRPVGVVECPLGHRTLHARDAPPELRLWHLTTKEKL
jgi:hypothetical protein